jgi:hypothetical protein
MKLILILVTFFIHLSCFCQQDVTPINKWTSYSIPLNPDSLNKYGFDLLGEWTVFIKNKEIFATKTRKKISDTLPFQIVSREKEKYKIGGQRSAIQVNDGYLVGFYRGEWGGNLYWFSKDGKQKYEISNHEVVQFIIRDNRIFAIEGLSHLSASNGNIIEIKKNGNKWISVESIKLPSAPYGVDIDDNKNLIIITSTSLLKIDTNFKIDILTEEHFWYPGLYPTSLVILDNIAYIGMRKGIFKYNLASKKQEWLMNDE